MIQMGFQLSSLTPYLKNQEEMKAAFTRVAEIGYRYVQLQGVPADTPDGLIAGALKENGLECAATQEDWPFGFCQDPDRAIRRAAACGSKYLTFALVPPDVDSPDKIEAFARELMPVYEKVKSAGLIFAYHPIAPDFRPIAGVPLYERLMGALPEDMQLTFCVQGSFGKVPYIEVLEKFAGRVDLVHFKDGVTQPDGTVQLMPLGEGEHDWKPIWDACEKAGVKYVFAEQERWDRDAFDCARASCTYLQQLANP